MKLVRIVMLATMTFMGVALSSRRAVQLWNGKFYDGVNERRWSSFAFRRRDLPRTFEIIRRDLKPREVVHLSVPDAEFDHGWWLTMGNYYLPENYVASVFRASERPLHSHKSGRIIEVPPR